MVNYTKNPSGPRQLHRRFDDLTFTGAAIGWDCPAARPLTDDGWSRRFDDPIVTPDGTRLITLRETVAYLAETVPNYDLYLPGSSGAERPTYAAERSSA
jgi:hypothetical protein